MKTLVFHRGSWEGWGRLRRAHAWVKKLAHLIGWEDQIQKNWWAGLGLGRVGWYLARSSWAGAPTPSWSPGRRRQGFHYRKIKIYRRSWINRISKIYRKYRTKLKKNQILLKKFHRIWLETIPKLLNITCSQIKTRIKHYSVGLSHGWIWLVCVEAGKKGKI